MPKREAEAQPRRRRPRRGVGRERGKNKQIISTRQPGRIYDYAADSQTPLSQSQWHKPRTTCVNMSKAFNVAGNVHAPVSLSPCCPPPRRTTPCWWLANLIFDAACARSLRFVTLGRLRLTPHSGLRTPLGAHTAGVLLMTGPRVDDSAVRAGPVQSGAKCVAIIFMLLCWHFNAISSAFPF